jgi:hypothetical protein
MDFTTLISMVLGFNAFIILLLTALYLTDKRHDPLPCKLEECCAELPTDACLPDPFVLHEGKWVCRDQSASPPLPPA